MTLYRRADGLANEAVGDEDVAKSSWLGYNAAVEAKGFSKEQADRVRSRKARSEWALQDTGRKVEARF